MYRLVLLITISVLFGCSGFLTMEEPLEETSTSPAASVATTPSAPPAQQSSTTPPPTQTAPAADPAVTEPPPAEEPPEVVEEPPAETLPEPGSIVEFTIQQGTGTGAWNTAEQPVVVYVGQVLKITNFDDRDHQMHASDNAPVPHGGRLVPGQSEEYVVSTALTVGDSAQAWDHGDGRSAAFWIEARDYPQQ